jgi:hypothetical protein
VSTAAAAESGALLGADSAAPCKANTTTHYTTLILYVSSILHNRSTLSQLPDCWFFNLPGGCSHFQPPLAPADSDNGIVYYATVSCEVAYIWRDDTTPVFSRAWIEP